MSATVPIWALWLITVIYFVAIIGARLARRDQVRMTAIADTLKNPEGAEQELWARLRNEWPLPGRIQAPRHPPASDRPVSVAKPTLREPPR